MAVIQAIPPSAIYLPVLATLFGGLVTFLAGVVGSLIIQKSQLKAERENLGSAFYGEISALLTITDKRRYVEVINEDLQKMHTTGQTSLTSFRTSRSHFNVYEQNVGKIGLLKAPLPEKIVFFYTLVFSVLEDFEDIGKGRYRNSAVLKASNQLKELRDILEEGILLGNEIRTLIKPPA